NEVKKEKMSDLLGVVPSVLFAPESLLSVKGSPGERRRILDIVLCQMSRKYLYDLQKYNKILKNKNILLRELQTGARHQEQLEVWNESQAKAGATVIGERKSIVTSLEKRMNRLLQGISDGRERINLKYKTLEDEDKPLYETLLNAIEKNSGREIEQGSCLIGPHRDDLEIYVNQRNSRVYCSQGQQRSVALAMNIAILEELEDKLGKAPILLLDDVMSELDEKRQRYLFDVIEKRQTIITTTEKSKFEKPGEKMISYIQVKDGKIVESHPG
ncbi:MAG: DNA replication and repair protein RecF, partial [Fibrobacter sp.]|nr:DNA replication and repair protein RecF [Fibrobacter sp.]